MRDVEVHERGAKSFCQRSRAGDVGRGQDGGELFPAVAGEKIRRALHAARHRTRDLSQGEITSLVPVLIVERLEVIDVDHHDRQRRAVASRARPFRLERLIELATIRDSGERVRERELDVALRFFLNALAVDAHADVQRARLQQRNGGQVGADSEQDDRAEEFGAKADRRADGDPIIAGARDGFVTVEHVGREAARLDVGMLRNVGKRRVECDPATGVVPQRNDHALRVEERGDGLARSGQSSAIAVSVDSNSATVRSISTGSAGSRDARDRPISIWKAAFFASRVGSLVRWAVSRHS